MGLTRIWCMPSALSWLPLSLPFFSLSLFLFLFLSFSLLLSDSHGGLHLVPTIHIIIACRRNPPALPQLPVNP